MRDTKIRLSIVDFQAVLSCYIDKRINSHGQAVISGYVTEEEEKKLIYGCSSEQFANIEIEGEEKEKSIIFTGIIESMNIEYINGLKKASVSLVAGTRLLESVERTRTFQNKVMTYEKILNVIEEKYSNVMRLMHEGDGAQIGDLIVQYKETDWDFIKRLASHFHTCIIPYFKQDGIRYHFGLPSSGFNQEITSVKYRIQNNVQEYRDKKFSKVKGIMEEDAYYYEVESREAYEIGEGVRFQSKPMYIYAIHSELKGSELIHTYQLKREGGFKLQKQYNHNLIGASLGGKILAVSKDTVKVHIDVDHKQDKGTAKWFPYSTVYSSPDGSGWYCMPEENDQVRVYFPNEKEEEGYVISSINVEPSKGNVSNSGTSTVPSSPPRSNPDNKSISNKQNKQVELTPTSITMTNNKGMTIKLDDNEGISIISDKDVTIQSDSNISIKSMTDTMNIEAMEAIELIQGESKIILKEDIVMEGAKVKIQ